MKVRFYQQRGKILAVYRSLRPIDIVAVVFSTAVSFGQTVSIKDGNVFCKAISKAK